MEKNISKKIIDINEEKVKDHLASIVRGTAEKKMLTRNRATPVPCHQLRASLDPTTFTRRIGGFDTTEPLVE